MTRRRIGELVAEHENLVYNTIQNSPRLNVPKNCWYDDDIVQHGKIGLMKAIKERPDTFQDIARRYIEFAIIDYFRSAYWDNRTKTARPTLVSMEHVDLTDTPDEHNPYEQMEMSRDLQNAMIRLPLKAFLIIWMHMVGGFSANEIAKFIGYGPANIWRIRRKSIESMRKQLVEYRV